MRYEGPAHFISVRVSCDCNIEGSRQSVRHWLGVIQGYWWKLLIDSNATAALHYYETNWQLFNSAYQKADSLNTSETEMLKFSN